MASLRDHHTVFAPPKQLPHWSQLKAPGPVTPTEVTRLPMVHPEPLRPIEPGESRSVRRPYHDEPSAPPRQQLPGVHELLSPAVRNGPRSPRSGSWAPINNNPTGWHDRLPPPVTTPGHGHNVGPAAIPPVLAPPYRPAMEMSMADSYRQANMYPPMGATGHRFSTSALPLRPTELSSPTSHGHHESMRAGDYFSSPPYHPLSNGPAHDERMLDRRSSSAFPGKSNAAGGVFNLQIVGQRDIPGEGLCYVFKDGSTCPTVIDGEPVNPLWGTTKAGKARKRLAQACLNCREKKIKCEPGETSCLQCEKAKRECQRPSITQTQAEMASGAALSTSPGNGEWKAQTSPLMALPIDPPAPKRRRSAHIAQQESAYEGPSHDMDSPGSEPKRRKSDDSSSTHIVPIIERPRKDSKRANADEDDLPPPTHQVSKIDVLAQAEDPYQFEPEGTMLFLDLFFSQSAREARMLFPRRAFTRWVRNCNSKSQRECMVLYSVLALGSAFSNNQYSTFAKICVDRATQAAAGMYGRFSTALVQARLLLGAYNHLKGKDGLAWDYNGSALRVIGAMRLNTEEGCGEELDEYRRNFNFTREQLRECRRRTFWAGFLMDRFNGFCSGLLSTVSEDDVFIRLPCAERIYEDGSASSAPFFDVSGAVSSDQQSPAAHVISISALWNEVVQFTQRSANYPASTYQSRYESFSNSMQKRLSDWNQGLPQHLKYSRETLEHAVHNDYAGDLVSMHTLYLFSQLRVARMIRYDLLPATIVARSICAAHSHALQLLALLRDIRVLTLSTAPHNRRTTDFMSPFIAYAMTSAIDTLGAGGLREEIVATTQVLSTAIEVLGDLSRYCSNAWGQLTKAEKRLAQIESWPPEHDIRTGRGVDGRCWRIPEPMEKASGLHQDVMYGVSSSLFAEALSEGRKR